MNLILSIIVIIVGSIMVRKPTFVWEIQTFLIVKDGEPTKFYLILVRTFGILAIVAGIAAFIFLIKQ